MGEYDMYTNDSFQEKLNILYQCIFGDKKISVQNLNYGVSNQDFPFNWYEPMRSFYATFSQEREFMKCMYDIKTPDEVVIENNIMYVAKERQGVCAYGVEIDTGRVIYLDNTNNIAEPINMQIEDFILYLIALQSSQFCVCSGKLSDCVETLESNFSNQRVSNNRNEGAVYFFSEGVILVTVGNDAFVSSRDDSFMEAFEETTSFEVDYF